jgi:hypothetical protein
MRGLLRLGWLVAVSSACGCAATPPVDNPVLVRPHLDYGTAENPIVVVPGAPTPEGYAYVYERVLEAVNDYFVTVPGPRYAGQIDTVPKIASGYEQPWKYASPDPRERLLATLQTLRHRAVVRIAPGERGGFRVYVEVYKELEDLILPFGSRNGPACFRELPVMDRRVDATGQTIPIDRHWIPAGRDPAYEQVILRKIQDKLCR